MNQATQSFLQRLAEDKFFGTVSLNFEAGLVVHVRKEENLKPSELSGEGKNYGNSYIN